jgi:hypothetical protein
MYAELRDYVVPVDDDDDDNENAIHLFKLVPKQIPLALTVLVQFGCNSRAPDSRRYLSFGV